MAVKKSPKHKAFVDQGIPWGIPWDFRVNVCFCGWQMGFNMLNFHQKWDVDQEKLDIYLAKLGGSLGLANVCVCVQALGSSGNWLRLFHNYIETYCRVIKTMISQSRTNKCANGRPVVHMEYGCHYLRSKYWSILKALYIRNSHMQVSNIWHGSYL